VLGHVGRIQRIAPDANETLTAAFVLPRDEMSIVNVARASGRDALARVVSGSDGATVTVVAGAGGRRDGAGGPPTATAFTGADTGPPVAAAAVLACVGIGSITLSRRKRAPRS
jgi:hypothetical protein